MKKFFRTQEAQHPNYPRLLDVGALRRWGLAALGGLLLGSGACRNDLLEVGGLPPRLAGLQVQPKLPASRDAGSADAGVPAPPQFLPGGEPPVERIQKPAAAAASQKKHAKKRRAVLRPPGTRPPERMDSEGTGSGE